MKQTQKEKQSILGPSDSVSSSGLKRQAPESSQLLKELDSAIKRKQKDTETERDAKRRRILERCGCL